MSDADRIRVAQAGASGLKNKRFQAAVGAILERYEQGQGASSCMAEIRAAFRALRQRREAGR